MGGGTLTYSRELLSNLSKIVNSDSIVLFINKETKRQGLFSGLGLEESVCNIEGSNVANRYLYEQFILAGKVASAGCDVLHSLGYVGPIMPPCAHVVSIHDSNFAVPFNKMPLLKRHILRWFVTKSAQKADAVITISKFSAGQIKKWTGIDESKIHVTYCSAKEKIEMSPYENTPKLYLLTGATTYPHKNIETVVFAFEFLKRNGSYPNLKLVVFGGENPYQLWLKKTVGKMGLGDSVLFTGYLKEKELNYLYANSSIFIFPSLYEGFGIPVIEAMRCGVPVISSSEGALAEIVSGVSLVLEDPKSATELAGKIESVLNDKNKQLTMIENGKKRAQEFSWEKTARKTYALYQSVSSRFRRS
jgi:glycosyltransferase involved in cell wall biosynthesis